MQPIAFIFFVQAEKILCDKAEKCFSLTDIDQNAFTNWLVLANNALEFYGVNYRPQINTFLNHFDTQFDTSLENNNLKYPLSYQQFSKQTKSITHSNNSDHEQ